jgi:4-oxalocrotonate tautomerase family enzyme
MWTRVNLRTDTFRRLAELEEQMPVAHINLLKGHSRSELKQIIIRVSEALAEILVAPKDRLLVWITEHDHHLFGLGGLTAEEALADGSLAELEMPFVQMVLMEGRPLEQFHSSISTVSRIIAEILGCDPKKVRVHIELGNPDRWGIGGVPASILRKSEIAART